MQTHIEEHGLNEEQSRKQITLKDKVGGGSWSYVSLLIYTDRETEMSKTNNYLTISEPLSKSMMIEMSQEPDLPGYISIYSKKSDQPLCFGCFISLADEL